MENFLKQIICCPDCSGELLSLDNALRCEKCSITFPAEEDIQILFSKKMQQESTYKVYLEEYEKIEKETVESYLTDRSYINMTPWEKAKHLILGGSSSLKARRNATRGQMVALSFCQFIGPTEGLTILDIGCREGLVLSFLMGGGNKVGLDISPFHLKYIKKKGNSGVAGFAERLPFKDNSFDLVISSHVLEHVLRPEAMTAEIERVMRPTGKAVIEVPFGETDESLSRIDEDTNRIVMKYPSGSHKKRRTALHLRNFEDEKDLEVLFPHLKLTRKRFHFYKLKRNVPWWVKFSLRPTNRLSVDSLKSYFPSVFSPRNIITEFISKE
ncbi:MAG: methyltransferase domain-containing protein [Candidatus Brocadiales bacterium]|nr:methyltransferase domain-containing protein [Candidatus Bathyanammoxibius sp.]MCQ4574447.1 methyltransferase domain-containing protein [Candidatus Bathyanammoxibius amoris]